MRRPRWVLGLAIAAVAAAPAAPARAQDGSAVDVVIVGRGWGHGVGLSQEGALSMAKAGSSLGDILSTFYPGTSIGHRSGSVRAELFDRPRSSVVVGFPSGGTVDQAGDGDRSSGFPVSVSPGGRVELSMAGGSFRVGLLSGATATPGPAAANPAATNPNPNPAPAQTTTTVKKLLGLIPLPGAPATTAPPPPTTAPPDTAPAEPADSSPVSSRPLVLTSSDGSLVSLPELDRRYRGTIRAESRGGALQLVDDLDVEDYLRGMGEVLEPGWPAAALQAQAVVARTYALEAMAAGRPLCSTQQCQVYVGQSVEYSAMDRAVAATAGEVVTYHGALAEAVYSANAGGVTATAEEGFGPGSTDYPYLTSVAYPSTDPDPWVVDVPLTDLAARFGYPGTPTGIAVSKSGPSGRALEVTIVGNSGPQATEGRAFADALGLRSTLFSVGLTSPGAGGGNTATGFPGARSATSRRTPTLLQAGGEAVLGRLPWVATAALLLAAAALACAAAARRRAVTT